MLTVNAGDGVPQGDTQKADRAQHHAQHKAGRELAADDAPPVPQVHLAECHRPDHQRRRLGARIAAARNDERNEQRQDHGLRDFFLEKCHRRRREHFAEEQRGQPAGTLSDHPPERDRQIRRVERFHAAELQDVFCRLGFDDVHHVVKRDPAEELPAGVHHGDRRHVVASHQPGHVFLILLRLHLHRRLLHHVPHQFRRRGDDQTRDRDDAGEVPLCVDRIDLIELALVLIALLADRFDRFRDARVFPNAHHVRGHQAAGGVLRIFQQPVDVGAVGDLLQHRLALSCRQLGNEVGRIVGRQLLHQLGRVLGTDGQEELLGMLGRFHLRERARGELGRQLRDHADAVCLVQGREDIGEIGRMAVLGSCQERTQIVQLGELLQLVESELGGFGRGHVALPPRAIVRTGPRRTATRSTRVALAARTSNSNPLSVKRSPARGMRPSA